MRPRSLTRPALVVASLTLALGLTACGEDDPKTNAQDDTSSSPTDSAPTSADATVTETETGTGSCTYAPDGTQSDAELPPASPSVTGKVPVHLSTSVGDLTFELDADRTPCTTNSFVSLAEQGYFDGTSCHRLTTSGIYVLQCGDPTGTGAGGPGYSFADELDGTETYGAGTLAMANAGPDTNGSQFFIVYDNSPLPPSYTVFGTVDDASVAIVKDVAKDGTDNANGQGDGAPNTAVDIDSVSVG